MLGEQQSNHSSQSLQLVLMKEHTDVCVHADDRSFVFVEIEASSRLKLTSTDKIGSINIFIGETYGF